MASLGLITGVLGFEESGTALMLTIFALQDSFGTACNVTGDGALTMILTGFAQKHGIKRHKLPSGLSPGPDWGPDGTAATGRQRRLFYIRGLTARGNM